MPLCSICCVDSISGIENLQIAKIPTRFGVFWCCRATVPENVFRRFPALFLRALSGFFHMFPAFSDSFRLFPAFSDNCFLAFPTITCRHLQMDCQAWSRNGKSAQQQGQKSSNMPSTCAFCTITSAEFRNGNKSAQKRMDFDFWSRSDQMPSG